MIKVTLSGMDQLQAALGGFQKQLPFALSKAINQVAKEVVKAEQQEIRSIFTVRNQWPEKGPLSVRIVRYAKKGDLTAVLSSGATFLSLHVTGGTKTPRGQHIAVPTAAVRRTKRDIIRKQDRPRNIKGSFVVPTSRGPMLARRKGKQIDLLYGLERSARIKPTFRWYETAQQTVDRTWRREIEQAIEYAIKTAR